MLDSLHTPASRTQYWHVALLVIHYLTAFKKKEKKEGGVTMEEGLLYQHVPTVLNQFERPIVINVNINKKLFPLLNYFCTDLLD